MSESHEQDYYRNLNDEFTNALCQCSVKIAVDNTKFLLVIFCQPEKVTLFKAAQEYAFFIKCFHVIINQRVKYNNFIAYEIKSLYVSC